MAVESSAVQITINVVDGATSETIAKVTSSLNTLGDTAPKSGKRVKKGLEDGAAGALSTLEKTKLLEEEIGIRLPKALVKLVAHNKEAQAALSALGTGMVAFGGMQIGVMVMTQIYDGAKKFYDKFLDVNKSVSDYTQEAGKAAQQKIFDTASLETANTLLGEAIRQIGVLESKKNNYVDVNIDVEGMGGGMYPGALPLRNFTPKDDKALADSYKNRDAAQARIDEITTQMSEKNVQSQNDFALSIARPWQKANVEKQNAVRLAQKHLEITQAHEKALHAETVATRAQQDAANKIPVEQRVQIHDINGKAGQAEYQQEIHEGELKARADSINTARETQDIILHLQADARQAQMHGVQLLEAQRIAADQAFVREHGSSTAAIKAIDAKYHAEERKQIEEQEREVHRMKDAAQLSGLSTIPRIQQEGRNRVSDLLNDPNSNMNPGQRLAAVHALSQQTNNDMLHAEQEFTDRIKQLSDESVEHQVAGFARIHAEAQKQIDDLLLEYQRLYGRDTKAPEYVAHQNQLSAGIGIIRAGERSQTTDLARRNAEETDQIETEARAHLLSAEKQQTAAIESEYEQRLRKYKEQLDQQEITFSDYNRRVEAASEMRDAQMVEASKQAREKMAGEFSGMFRGLEHPTQYLTELGNKFAGQAAAALVQRAQNHYGGPGASATPLTIESLFGKVSDKIAGAPSPAQLSAPSMDKPANKAHGWKRLFTPSSLNESAPKNVALSTAEIHIQSASISLGNIGAAASSSSQGGSLQIGSIGSSAAIGGGTPSSGEIGASAMSGLAAAGASGTTLGSSSSGQMKSDIAGGSYIGGAGSATPSYLSTLHAAGNVGASAGSGSTRAGLENFTKGLDFVSQARSIFGKKKKTPGSPKPETEYDSLNGTLNEDGSFTSDKPQAKGEGSATNSTSNSSNSGAPGVGTAMNVLGGIGGTASLAKDHSKFNRAMNGAEGAIGVYSAYESNGGVSGGLSGAMSGMQLGMAIGGPMGAAIGAASGAIIGALGFGGRERARRYDLREVRPRIGTDSDSYQGGGMDYLSAYSDLQSLDMEAKKTTNGYGPGGRSYYQDTIKKEILQARNKLTAEEKAGRSHFTATAAQFDQGGWTGNFGSMATGPDSGWAHLKSDEFVVTEQPAAEHAGALEAIRSGASKSDMARYYGAAPTQMVAASQPSWGGDIHVHALDAKTAYNVFMENRHTIRKAVNASFAENSGGADA